MRFRPAGPRFEFHPVHPTVSPRTVFHMIKSLLRRTLAAAGLKVIRTNHPAARYVDRVPASPLDFLILWLFPEPRGRTFLQIGAHDGIRNDPIYRWIVDHGWRGTLVEPMPDFAATLRRLHAKRSGVRVVEAAITVDRNATPVLLYRVDPTLPGLPPWAQGLATLDPARMHQAARDLGISPEAFLRVPVITMDPAALLAGLESPVPDIIVIDTEGYDILLARALLQAGCSPTILHFEHACCTAEERFTLVRELAIAGYETVSFGADTTAFRAERRFAPAGFAGCP